MSTPEKKKMHYDPNGHIPKIFWELISEKFPDGEAFEQALEQLEETELLAFAANLLDAQQVVQTIYTRRFGDNFHDELDAYLDEFQFDNR